MLRSLRALFVIALLAAPALAQLQNGDVLFACSTNYRHYRAGVGTLVVPTPSVGSPAFTQTNFNNGSLLFLPGTQYVLVATGLSPVGIWLLDFSTSIAAPTAYYLGAPSSTTLAITQVALDRLTGDIYFLQGTNVGRIPAPITTTTTVPGTYFATGQTGATAMTVLNNSQVVVSNATTVWTVVNGATAPGATVLTLAASGSTDLKYDAAQNRLLVANFGLSRVDSYNLATNLFISTLITTPTVSLVDAIDVDEVANVVYLVARNNATIGGSPYGVITGNDNVILSVSGNGGANTAVGISPPTGNPTGTSNTGVNGYIAVVKPQTSVVNSLILGGTTTPTFGAGTMTASPTVQTISGLPSITSSAVDALIGATVTLNGTFTGSDTTFLSNLSFSNLTMDFFVPPASVGGTPTATISFASSTNSGVVARFVGPSSAQPTARRRYTFTSPTVTVNNSAASASLTNFAGRISGGTPFSIDFGADGVPSIGSLDLSAPTGLTGFEFRARTASNGNFELGVINATPFAEHFFLATTTLSTPLGSGPFLGLAADPLLFTIASYPIGVQPFHFLYNVNGQYYFSLPSGSVPAGISIDSIVLQYIPGVSVQNLPVQRTAF